MSQTSTDCFQLCEWYGYFPLILLAIWIFECGWLVPCCTWVALACCNLCISCVCYSLHAFKVCVKCGSRCSGRRCLSCVRVWDGTDVCTCLGCRTDYCCHLHIVYSDIGDVMKSHPVCSGAVSLLIANSMSLPPPVLLEWRIFSLTVCKRVDGFQWNWGR